MRAAGPTRPPAPARRRRPCARTTRRPRRRHSATARQHVEVLGRRGRQRRPPCREHDAGPALRPAAGQDLGHGPVVAHLVDEQLDGAVAERDAVAGPDLGRAATGGARRRDARRWSPVRRGGHQLEDRALSEVHPALGELGRPDLGPGEVGQHADDLALGVGRLPARGRCAPASPSTVPWASETRAMFMPAAIIARIVSRSSEAGPMVATIFVRRSLPSVASNFVRCSMPPTLWGAGSVPPRARRRHHLPHRSDDRSGRAGAEVEARGFHSLYLPEHTHIPVSRRTPLPPASGAPGDVSPGARSLRRTGRGRGGDGARPRRHGHRPRRPA